MNVGIFHPPLNVCGGAELVAVNIIKTLKEQGHKTIVLTNEPVDRERIRRIFGEDLPVDREIVFPFQPFPPASLNNVYPDCARTFWFKQKCDILIDTQSNGLLPGVDISYIHHPIFSRFRYSRMPLAKSTLFYPYHLYERTIGRKNRRLVFSNSKYTANAISEFVGINSVLLYPPISEIFFIKNNMQQPKQNLVVSVSRISPEKYLTLIPEIAKLTEKHIRFLIIGMRQSNEELERINNIIKKNNLSDRVELAIDVPRKVVIEKLRIAKILLHTAKGEHFGMSIAEGMASGCIPIVHDSGGPREMTDKNLRFKTIEEAANKINYTITQWSTGESSEMASNATVFSSTHFSNKFTESFNKYIISRD